MSDSDIIQDFLTESYENLDRLDRELVSLETNPQDGSTLASVFRTIHTIKGTCGFLSFNRLEKVAHVGENLLSRLRDGQLTLTPEITTGLLSMVDAVRQMLAEIKSTGSDGANDYADLTAELTRLLESGVAKKIREQAPSVGLLPNADGQAPSSPSQQPETSQPDAMSAAGASAETSTAVAANVKAVPAQAPPATENKAPEVPKVAKNAPRKPVAGRIGGVLVQRGTVQPEDIARALEEQEKGDRRRLGEILVALGLAKEEDINAAQQILESRSHDTSVETIRVGVNLLDKLMNQVGELVLARNQLMQFSNVIQDTGFQAISQRMNLIASELQEEVMKTRMQPIGIIWGKFPRTVRDVALNCKKEVRLEMEGKETELDKTIIEAISDPLTHLVRNAVDHGIELPEIRRMAGKQPSGQVTLRAFHEGGQVNIEVSDDGAGLDPERIRKKALERGLITTEQAARMTEQQMFNLIFLPGFSTAEKVTNVSGRGVGMDVVKTNVERIGGAVDVQSSRGKGTTVRVKIPLTLAIIPALLVTCDGDRFAIPQVSMTELVRLESGAVPGIEMVHGTPVYRLRGKLLPLLYLKAELRSDKDNLMKLVEKNVRDGEVANIVVLQTGDRSFGLVVDSINDTEEIVVKPLRKQLKQVKVFAGASIMGDGKVALILDVMGLAQRANVANELRENAMPGTDAAQITDEVEQRDRRTVLLFQNGERERMAIELSQVARLEEFSPDAIEIADGREVVQYRGQIMPLLRVAELLETRQPASSSSSEPLQVVVYNNGGKNIGLVIDRILDMAEGTIAIEPDSGRPGVMGSAVIQERITGVLDIPGLMALAEIDGKAMAVGA